MKLRKKICRLSSEPSKKMDLQDRLQKLKDVFDAGLIEEDEYKSSKANLLKTFTEAAAQPGNDFVTRRWGVE
jgi:hypothetical protein